MHFVVQPTHLLQENMRLHVAQQFRLLFKAQDCLGVPAEHVCHIDFVEGLDLIIHLRIGFGVQLRVLCILTQTPT